MAKVDITAGKYVDYLKKVTAKIASEKDYITSLMRPRVTETTGQT